MKPLKEFELNRETKSGVAVLHLIGQVDDYSLGRLQAALEALHLGGQHRIVVDCDNLDYVSTLAIRALIDRSKQAREEKGDLILVKVPPKIRQIIDVVGLKNEVKIVDKEKDAIDQLADKTEEKE